MKKQRWRRTKRLKKGDKVMIHTHKYADMYKGYVFTCDSNEERYSDYTYVWLKELNRTFLRRFLIKVGKKGVDCMNETMLCIMCGGEMTKIHGEKEEEKASWYCFDCGDEEEI